MSKSVRRKCSICLKSYKKKSLFACAVERHIVEVCINCRNRICNTLNRNLIILPDSGFIHEVVFCINKVNYSFGIERSQAINLVLENITRLDCIEEISMDWVKSQKLNQPKTIRLNGRVFEVRQRNNNDIFDRAVRMPGCCYSKQR